MLCNGYAIDGGTKQAMEYFWSSNFVNLYL